MKITLLAICIALATFMLFTNRRDVVKERYMIDSTIASLKSAGANIATHNDIEYNRISTLSKRSFSFIPIYVDSIRVVSEKSIARINKCLYKISTSSIKDLELNFLRIREELLKERRVMIEIHNRFFQANAEILHLNKEESKLILKRANEQFKLPRKFIVFTSDTSFLKLQLERAKLDFEILEAELCNHLSSMICIRDLGF